MTHQRPTYPPARKADVIDTYHGVPVRDPYRWLEDPDSPDTRAWVEAQNALTRSILDGPARQAVVERLTTLYNYPRTTVPIMRGPRAFFTHNTGLQDQPVLYVQDGPHLAPRVLVDPNALGAEGPIAITALAPNEAGTEIAYGLSASGSDRQEILIRDAVSGMDRRDRLAWVKFASIAWVKEGTGFYYTRFPQPGSVADGDENYFNQVCFHHLGDSQARDVLVFDRPEQRETVFGVEVSADDRWAVMTAFQGSSDRSEVYLLDRQSPGAAPLPIFTGFTSAYTFIEECGGRLFFLTDDGAPRGRIIAVDPQRWQSAPVEVVAEAPDKLWTALIVHRMLVTSYLHDASDRVHLFELSGEPAADVPLPGLGSVTGMTGRPEDDELFLGFTSFTYPPTNYRYDFAAGSSSVWSPASEFFRLKAEATGVSSLHAEATGVRPLTESPWLPPSGGRESPRPDDYVTTQVWYPSRDGTKVSMFLVHRKDLTRDGRRPVLLSGYGGFNISLTPSFDPATFVLLDTGGIYALANLRGGGEYGEAWHQAGMFERKQNVFDDFIAAAEWLTMSGYAGADTIAIEGGSNGGLLTAAVMVQRPELFGAVVCRVPVADMLRYHLFTVGRFWMSEYGSADDPEQFPYLYKYSPYHNVRDGVAYPPILIMTADTDDRVSPGMAKKLAARLQEADGDDSPVLIRVETKAGHGAGKPVSKLIDEDADIYAFLFKYLLP